MSPKIRHHFAIPTLALLSIVSAAAVCSQLAPQAQADDDAKEMQDAQNAQKVDVGGHKLALLTMGHGDGPTVVIEAGFGCPAVESGEWKGVCREVAKRNRVCLYDRAGLGTSDPAAKKPRTCKDVARDLNALLKNAGVPGPYVLVGHSLGGMHVLVYADLYPEDVAGIVLVDSAHADQDAKWLATLPEETEGEDKAVKGARKFLTGRMADRGNNVEALDRVASRDEVRAVKSLGKKPLAVLTHSPDWKMVPDLPESILKPIERVSQELQAGLPSLSTDSSHRIAKKAGHAIHVEDPELVVEGIREVVGKVRGNTSRATR